MTQKEEFSKEELQKAKELAKDYAPAIENVDAKIVLYDAILEMSQWKEKQMIEKACEKLVEIELEDKDTEDVANEEQDHIYVLNNHFLKKFKQKMEE